MNREIHIAPLKPNDVPLLKQAAESDGHGVIFPSHIVRKNGEIVGYVSLCSTPIFSGWAHTQKMSAIDTLFVLDRVESYARMNGRNSLAPLCTKNSPFFPGFARRYTDLGNFQLFEKVL